MGEVRVVWLGLAVGMTLIAGCGDSHKSKDASQTVARPSLASETDAGTLRPSTDEPDERDATVDDAGEVADPDPESTPPKIAGTSEPAMCHSYTQSSGNMCSGFFCGVTVESLKAETAADAPCNHVEFLCNVNLNTAVGTCARRERAANLRATDEEVAKLISECVYEDAEMKRNVSQRCLDCFVDSVACGGSVDTCLFECLASDSPECDQCLRDHHCLDGSECTGLPNPF